MAGPKRCSCPHGDPAHSFGVLGVMLIFDSDEEGYITLTSLRLPSHKNKKTMKRGVDYMWPLDVAAQRDSLSRLLLLE